MATPQWLQMLDSSQRQTAQALGFISDTMHRQQQFELQKDQFVADTAFRSAQMAEQRRMNNAKLAETAMLNRIRAESHQADMQLHPFRMEEARLGLEARKINTKRQLTEGAERNFNAMSQPYDERAGSTFAENQNPEFIREYRNLKSQWRGRLQQGEQWDEDRYREEYMDMEARFLDQPPAEQPEEYDREVSAMLGQMGLHRAQARFEAIHNPAIKSNLNGIRASLIDANDQTFSRAMPENAQYLGEEGTLNLYMARQAIKGMELEKQRAYAEWQQANQDSEADQEFIDEKWNDFRELDRTTNQMRKAAIQGRTFSAPNFDEDDGEDGDAGDGNTDSQTTGDVQRLLEQSGNNQSQSPLSVTGEERRIEDRSKAIQDAVTEISTFKDEDGNVVEGFNPLEGLDIGELSNSSPREDRNWFQNMVTEDSRDHDISYREVRRNVSRNLRGMDELELKGLLNQPWVINTFKEFNDEGDDLTFGYTGFPISSTDAFRFTDRIDSPVEEFQAFTSSNVNRVNTFGKKEDILDYVAEGKSEAERRSRFTKAYSALVAAKLEMSARKGQ